MYLAFIGSIFVHVFLFVGLKYFGENSFSKESLPKVLNVEYVKISDKNKAPKITKSPSSSPISPIIDNQKLHLNKIKSTQKKEMKKIDKQQEDNNNQNCIRNDPKKHKKHCRFVFWKRHI